MKLLSLNTWGGRMYGPLMDFLSNQINDGVDFFCLQEVFANKDKHLLSHEVRANLWQELSELFLDYHKFYDPVMKGYDSNGPVNFDLTFGSAMFVKRDIKILEEGDYFTYRKRFAQILLDYKDTPVNVQYANLKSINKQLQIYNFHGIWYPGDKLDTPERIEQSEKLLAFMDHIKGAKILCGDFNLMPDSRSLKMLDKGYRDLIKEYKIDTTRSDLNPYKGTPNEQRFADYLFISSEVKIIDFQMLKVNVSDHLPMILEFEV